MEHPELKHKKAQATLEFTIVFVIMVILLFGLLNMWMWSNNNIVLRQKWYNQQRKAAGSTDPGYTNGGAEPQHYPVSPLQAIN